MEKADALMQMGWMAHYSDREETKQLYEQSLALYQALGDRWGTANALASLGGVAWHLGNYSEARPLFEESLAIRQSLVDQRGVANLLMSLGLTALFQGQLEESERLLRESVAIRQVGDRRSVAHGLNNLAGGLVFLGKYVEAHSLLEESLAIYHDLGLRYSIPSSMLGLAKAHLGKYKQARAQSQAALVLARAPGRSGQRAIGFALFVLGCVMLAEETWEEAQHLLQESVAAYQEIEQREELCWALALLGIAAHRLGESSQMRQHLSRALRMVAEIGTFVSPMYALPAICLLLADQSEQERAVELYALASRYPIVANSRWFEDVAGRHIAAVAATLPPQVVAAAQERGRARGLDATVAELLVELEEQ